MTQMTLICQKSFPYRWNSDDTLKFLILYRWNTRPVSGRKPVDFSNTWIYTGFIPVKIPGIYPAGSGANPGCDGRLIDIFDSLVNEHDVLKRLSRNFDKKGFESPIIMHIFRRYDAIASELKTEEKLDFLALSVSLILDLSSYSKKYFNAKQVQTVVDKYTSPEDLFEQWKKSDLTNPIDSSWKMLLACTSSHDSLPEEYKKSVLVKVLNMFTGRIRIV